MGFKDDGKENLFASDKVHDIENNNPTAERDGHLVPESDASGYRIREQPYGTKKKLRVILMGAGASTVNFLKRAEEEMSDLDICVYEKNSDVGGTWLENRYIIQAPV